MVANLDGFNRLGAAHPILTVWAPQSITSLSRGECFSSPEFPAWPTVNSAQKLTGEFSVYLGVDLEALEAQW